MTQQPWGQPAPAQAPWGQQPQQQPAQQPWGQPAQQPAAQPWGQPQQQRPAQGGDEDPFALAQKTPAVSFKDAPIGASVTLRITEKAVQRQQTDFETQQLDFWPPSDADRAMGKTVGNPKMAAVVRGVVVDGPHLGEERSVWAPMTSKQGSMCAAIAAAQQEAGERIAPGGHLTITLVGTEPPDNPRMSPRKLYAARYVVPGVGSPSDAFAGGQQAPQDAPAYQQPAPQQAPQQMPPPEWAGPAQQGYAPPQSGPQDAPQTAWGQQAQQPGTVQHFQQAAAQPQDAVQQPAPAAAPPSNPWG